MTPCDVMMFLSELSQNKARPHKKVIISFQFLVNFFGFQKLCLILHTLQILMLRIKTQDVLHVSYQ